MANLMPGEWDWQIQDAERKRKFADLLRQQAQPQGQMVGNTYVAPSWTQRLAAVVNNIQGQRMANDADQTEKQAYDAQRQKYQVAAQKLAEALKGKPAIDGNSTDDAAYQSSPGFYQPAKPVSTDDILGAQVQYGSDIGDPNVLNNAVSSTIGYRMKQQDRADDQDFKTKTLASEQAFREQQAQLQREAQAQALQQQIASREQAGRDSADLRRELAQMQMQNSRDLAAMRAQNGGNPYYQALPTAQGYAKFNARTGQMEPISINGQSVLPAAQDPTLQGKLSGAKAVGEAEGKRQYNMGGVGDVISQARNILSGLDPVTGQKQALPTASGVGNLADAIGATVGYAVPGAAQADQLKAIGGQLVSKMPRMEGPQSNYDVQNYKEMAGDVGNPNLPIERRLAALKAVENIVKKYDKSSAAGNSGWGIQKVQ